MTTKLLQNALDDIKLQERHDPVNKPLHYAEGAIECIDAIEAALGPDGFESYLTGNCLKYLWRWRKKGSHVQDLQKCDAYLKRLISTAIVNDAQNIGPEYERPFKR